MPNTVTIRTKIHDEASKGFGGLVAGLGSLVGGALIPATAAAAALGVELVGAGAAAGVFGAAVMPQIQSIKQAATGQNTYNTAVSQYGAKSKQAQAAQQKFHEEMKQMPAATRATATAFFSLKDSFGQWSSSLSSSTMPVFTHAMQGLKNIFPLLNPLVKSAAGQFDQLSLKFKAFTTTDRFKQLVSEFSSFASGALKNVISGITALSKGLVHGFESQGFKNFLATGRKEGPGIVTMFQNLARFVGKFVQAAGPLAGLQLKALEVLAKTLNAIPMGVLQVLAPALLGAAAAMRIMRVAMMGMEIARGLALGMQLLAGATLQADVAMDANPIGAVVAILVLLGVAIYEAVKHWRGLKTAVIDVWHAMEFAVGHAIAGILMMIKAFLDGWLGAMSHIPIIGHMFAKVRSQVDGELDGMINKSNQWGRANKKNSADTVGSLSSVASKVRSLPTGHSITVKALTNDAIRALQAAGYKVTHMPNGSFKITANTGSAQSRLASIRAQLNSLHDRQINIRVAYSSGGLKAAQAMGRVRRAGGQAASGGLRGNQVMVGEDGPELVNLPTGSYVHSNPDSQRVMGQAGSGGGTIVIPVYLFEGGHKFMDLVVDPLRKSVQKRGGVQAALGKL